MVKFDYTKVEQAFDRSVNQATVSDIQVSAVWLNLTEGTLAYQTKKDPKNDLINKTIEKILLNVIRHLKYIKEKHPDYYIQLAITTDEETRLSNPNKLTQENWKRLKEINDKIEEYLRSNRNSTKENPEDAAQIETQLKEHIHKRYNVKKGWVPL